MIVSVKRASLQSNGRVRELPGSLIFDSLIER
jgi:hypothetical protein